jgi:hypothetical protein
VRRSNWLQGQLVYLCCSLVEACQHCYDLTYVLLISLHMNCAQLQLFEVITADVPVLCYQFPIVTDMIPIKIFCSRYHVISNLFSRQAISFPLPFSTKKKFRNSVFPTVPDRFHPYQHIWLSPTNSGPRMISRKIKGPEKHVIVHTASPLHVILFVSRPLLLLWQWLCCLLPWGQTLFWHMFLSKSLVE